MRFSKRKLHFFVFMLENRNRKKKKKNKKGKITKNPIKIGFFKVVIQKCENHKKWIFSQNCLTLFVSGREKKRICVATICFGQIFFWTKTV